MKELSIMIYSSAAWLLLASGAAIADRESQNDFRWFDGRHSLVGAWQVETTVRRNAADCANADPLPPLAPNPFPSFSTFHFGGTMNEQGSRSPPARRSPGFGIWKRTGRHDYSYRVMFQSFDVNGLLAATMDIRTQLVLAKDGETFDGISRFVRTDISGNVLNFCATMNGQRITL